MRLRYRPFAILYAVAVMGASTWGLVDLWPHTLRGPFGIFAYVAFMTAFQYGIIVSAWRAIFS